MSREWRDSAACRDQAPDFDYSVDGETPTQRAARLDAAVRTCYRCPVMAQCHTAVDPMLDDGVRAGVVLEKIKNVRAGGGRGDVAGRQKKRKVPATTNRNNRDHEGNRRELVLELTGKGLSAQQISDRLGVSTRAVARHRAAGRAA